MQIWLFSNQKTFACRVPIARIVLFLFPIVGKILEVLHGESPIAILCFEMPFVIPLRDSVALKVPW